MSAHAAVSLCGRASFVCSHYTTFRCSCDASLLFRIVVLIFIPHAKLDAGRMFQVSSDPYLNSVGNGVPALMPAHKPVAGVTEQASDKPCSVAVIHYEVRLALADVAALEAAETQQPQELSARQVQVLC